MAVSSEAGFVVGRSYGVFSRSCQVTGVAVSAQFFVSGPSAPSQIAIAVGVSLGLMGLAVLAVIVAAFVHTGTKLKHL